MTRSEFGEWAFITLIALTFVVIIYVVISAVFDSSSSLTCDHDRQLGFYVYENKYAIRMTDGEYILECVKEE